MKLINTDGMAFIGPGSEWFWTALTGLVLAATFIGIYRHLSVARSASAREQLASFDRECDAERMLRHRLALRVALRDGADPAQLLEGSAVAVANFWSRTGQLARSGDLDRKALYRGLSGVCQKGHRLRIQSPDLGAARRTDRAGRPIRLPGDRQVVPWMRDARSAQARRRRVETAHRHDVAIVPMPSVTPPGTDNPRVER